MLNLDPSQRVHAVVVLLHIMVPTQVFCRENEQTLRNLGVRIMALLQNPAFMQHCFVVIFKKHNLHLLHDEALQQNERHVLFSLVVFGDQNSVFQCLVVKLNLLVLHI